MLLKIFSKHKKEKEDKTYFFDGQKVSKMQNYGYGILVENQIGDWNRLTNYLKDNSINIYCTFNAFDNFANTILATGHVQDFIDYTSAFVKKYPANIYNMLMNGTLTIVEFE